MKDRCRCCRRIKDVQPIMMKRKYHTRVIKGANICRDCWEGNGESFPVVYFP